MIKRKAFVLASGGMDSTTCLHKAIVDFKPFGDSLEFDNAANFGVRIQTDGSMKEPKVDWVEAISINYGQRHLKESQYALAMCDRFGIEHHILPVYGLSGNNVMLTDPNVAIPNISYSEIRGVSPTYVPYRNGNLLSAITAHAQKWVNEEIKKLAEFFVDIETRALDEQEARRIATNQVKDSAGIYFGAHSEDAANWAYPDCTPEFIGAQANAIYIGSYQAIRLYTPLQWLSKAEVVTLGEKLGVDWSGTWSCYAGGDKHCGVCPTCRARKGAFTAAGVNDPTDYIN
jgi:7-cyano-7-deazaguanine synthase